MVRVLKSFLSKHHEHRLPLFMYALLFLLTICTASTAIWYGYTRYTYIAQTEKRVATILASTESSINAYLDKEQQNALTLANSEEIKTFLETLNEKTSHKQSAALLEELLLEKQKSMDGRNVLLVDAQKTIQYSYSRKHLIGKQVTEDNHLLYLSYERSMMSLTPDFSEYGHDPLFKVPTLFISIPIISKKKFLGILAYECNLHSIAAFTQQYKGLGKTGEIVFAQQNKSFLIYVAPTRNDRDRAFKREKISSKNPIAMQAGTLGNQGTGIATDYRDIDVIAAWSFIPKINWGLLVKIDQAEAKKILLIPFYLLLLSLLILCSFVVFIEYYYHRPFAHTIEYVLTNPFVKHIPSSIKNYFFIFLLIALGVLGKAINTHYAKQNDFSHKEKENIVNDIIDGAENINQLLKKISFSMKSIADDLQLDRLAKEDIIRRIKRDLSENEMITQITVAFAPHAYNAEKDLYAPSVSRHNNTYQEKTLEYNYTDPHDQAAIWYTKAAENGEVWLDLSLSNKESVTPFTYSVPFFDAQKQVQGVVCATYSLTPIEHITRYSSLDRNGYSFLMAKNGRFVLHPIHDLVTQGKSLLEYAQDNGSTSLAAIAEKLADGKSRLSSYTLHNENRIMWMYTHIIPVNGWALGTVFSKEDILLPLQTVRHDYFRIILCSVIALLILIFYLHSLGKLALIPLVSIVNLILCMGLIFSWRTIQITASPSIPDSTIITDQASLDNFLENLEEEANRKNEEPAIKIPCGLSLYSIGMLQPKEMTISGYFWNKYNIENHANITREIQVPHATKLIKDPPTMSTYRNWETVTWNFRGIIFQKQNYALYPFDKQQMQITLEHHDIEKNIILVPDLEDYKKISPEDTPGIDKNFTIAGFNVERSFFSYKKITPLTNFGFGEYGKTTDNYLLSYNLIIRRNLLNPFVLFFLPLLVVLFSLFSVLLVAQRDSNPLSIISGYTGLFFALVVLQRSLREQYPTSTTLYMEYAFFFTYISIILLVIHTVLIYLYPTWDYYQKKAFHGAKLIFWPLQLASWLITTIIIFY